MAYTSAEQTQAGEAIREGIKRGCGRRISQQLLRRKTQRGDLKYMSMALTYIPQHLWIPMLCPKAWPYLIMRQCEDAPREGVDICAGVWQVYAGPLEDGSRAVALFNRHTSGTQYPVSNITVRWESIGEKHSPVWLTHSLLRPYHDAETWQSTLPSSQPDVRAESQRACSFTALRDGPCEDVHCKSSMLEV